MIVIGAGFSGLNMAIRLKQAGHDDFVVLERASELGGTWRDNVYPGCACDVPSMLYSFSFEQNPDWTTAFAGSDEIKAYLSRCAEKYGIARHLRFGTSIVRAEFDERAGLWTLHAEDGRAFSPLSRLFEKQGRAHLHRQVKDPELRAKLMPSFHIGCKRLLISNDFYPALTKPNVELVTDAIESFTERGMRTADGREHEVDVVVFATGFKIEITQAPYDIRGLGGLSLSDAWNRPGAKAYKGVATAGIPNWFIMLGPNTGPGHTSVLVYTEAQAGYILQAVERVLTGGIKYLTVKRAVQDYYGQKLKARMRYTTWSSGCVSWYLDENGENHTLYPGLASEYVLGMRRFDDHEYVEVPFTPRAPSTQQTHDPTLSEQPK